MVTINAVDQTLPQILDRVARQVALRYEYAGDNLIIQPDDPYFVTYKVNYLNMSRDTVNTNSVATSLATTSVSMEGGGGGSEEGAFGGNNSTTELTSKSLNQFWASITNNISAILGEDVGGKGELTITNTVIPNPESGVLTVLATANQHKQIQEFLDLVQANVRRQVLIQITIIEVNLSDQYEAGIDWTLFKDLGAFSFTVLTGGTVPAVISGATGLVLNYEDSDTKAALQLLEEFGDIKILSSPQLMVLNNQTAVLKRVENKVFFIVDSETLVSATGVGSQSFDTTVHTLPVGIVMTITPYIDENDEIMLLVRPTISRETGVLRAVPTPTGVVLESPNEIPETVSQEMESLIRINSGQIAILGGLMDDQETRLNTGVPGVTQLPLVGNLFNRRSIRYEKTETVIFIKPLVIRNPSIDDDLQLYKTFLEQTPDVPGSVEVNSP
ncbi:MAG: secretin N-terminal domain-containing protein [Gammaproteobacteria bacterium]|nr:secretin N-terminal domain-containing protein [Gammaproteobacteria bacterium]